MSKKPEHLHDPYCGNCGYKLTGLVDSSKCPECGKPLVEVVSRIGQWGRRYRSEATLFGLPVIDVAFGPRPGERIGRARGVIALGDRATGLVAVGGFARGAVAVGGNAIGLFTLGGFSFGLVAAWGGVAIGALSYGGLALGMLASGGLVLGIVATGGLPIGYYAMGGAPVGVHRLGPGVSSSEAIQMLGRLSWFFGPPTAFTAMNLLQPLVVIAGLVVAAAAGIGLLALWGHLRGKPSAADP
ncbi:MAG: hypothetical protein IH830_00185 [Planctomycetes bacterium]|nr:hypothetical protein [Planctomycetota bacterium]